MILVCLLLVAEGGIQRCQKRVAQNWIFPSKFFPQIFTPETFMKSISHQDFFPPFSDRRPDFLPYHFFHENFLAFLGLSGFGHPARNRRIMMYQVLFFLVFLFASKHVCFVTEWCLLVNAIYKQLFLGSVADQSSQPPKVSINTLPRRRGGSFFLGAWVSPPMFGSSLPANPSLSCKGLTPTSPSSAPLRPARSWSSTQVPSLWFTLPQFLKLPHGPYFGSNSNLFASPLLVRIHARFFCISQKELYFASLPSLPT